MAAVSSYVDHALHNYKEYHPVVESMNSENCALYKLAIQIALDTGILTALPGHLGGQDNLYICTLSTVFEHITS